MAILPLRGESEAGAPFFTRRFFVAPPPEQNLLLCAKHLLCEATIAPHRSAGVGGRSRKLKVPMMGGRGGALSFQNLYFFLQNQL